MHIEIAHSGIPSNLLHIITSVADQILHTEQITYNIQVDVTITDNETIRRLNSQHRGKDCPTDVLSFPLLDFTTPGVLTPQPHDFEGDKLPLGDIVISLDRAKAQSEEYGHSLEREIGFLTAHSMLHLLGYDHETQEQETVMIQKQESTLAALGLKRE